MDDASTDARRIGHNVRKARRYRGLSLEVAAGLVGRSKAWLSKVENGITRLDRRGDIAAIAEALGVSATDLLGEGASIIRPHSSEVDFVALRDVLLDTTLDAPDDIPAQPLHVLEAQAVGELLDARRAADFKTETRLLPGLIGELQVHAATTRGEDRERALRLLVDLCGAAMGVLRNIGQVDLAWIAADRADRAAAALDHPVWTGAATWARAHTRTSATRSHALMSTAEVADRIEPELGDDRTAHEVYGMLQLSAALACLMTGDSDGVTEHAAEAARIAERWGERSAAFQWFGPANVGTWRIMLAVEAGEPAAGLSYAEKLDERALPPRRRSALAIERGRANAMLGRDAAAISELCRAERLSAEQVHNNPLTRELVADLLDQARREAGGRELRGLAWRMSII